MGVQQSKGGGEGDRGDRTCGGCSEESNPFAEMSCVKRGGSPRVMSAEAEVSRAACPGGGGDHGASGEGGPGGVQPRSPHFHYGALQQPQSESWRFNAGVEDAVGVGAYFGRLDWQTDSVARVKSLVAGGPAEQTGMITIGDALCSVDDVDVYGQPLCELGKHVLGPSGSVVKLTFEKCTTGERYVTNLVRGKGVLTVM